MLLNRCSLISRQYLSSISTLYQKKPPPPPPMEETPRKLLYRTAKNNFPVQEISISDFQLKPGYIPQIEQNQIEIIDHREKYQRREIIPTVQAVQKDLKTSVKKTVPFARQITGKSYYDAYQFLENQETKSSKFLLSVLIRARTKAVNGFQLDEQRLYVQQVITGKNRPIKRIKIQAKGKFGRMTRPRTQITIILEEKTIKQIYEITKSGKYPKALAQIARDQLFQEDCDFDVLKRNALLLSNKGRKIAQTQFKRQIYQSLEEAKQQGYYLTFKAARDKILEKESAEFARAYEEKANKFSQDQLSERQHMFQANEKKYS